MKQDKFARHSGDMGARQGKQVSRLNKTYDKNLEMLEEICSSLN